MSETLEQTVPTDAAGSRLDKWLIQQEAITISRSMLQSLMEQGAVLVNDQPVAKNYKVKAQDKVAVTIPEPVSLSLEPENIPLDIVYEDDDLLVVNKPKGMVVHPAPGNLTGTLVHALLYHCGDRLSSINGAIRPGIVHRIDKNTSGLLMVAKTDFAHHALSAQIQAHTFTREYQAICIGHLKEASGTICAPIGRHPVDRKKMCVTQQHAKPATTHYMVLAEYRGYSHLRLRLETGRTHQIRVHMAYVGHPLLGDDVYGTAVKGLEGQCLHAGKIGFVHPVTGAYMEFERAVPEYFQALLDRFQRLS